MLSFIKTSAIAALTLSLAAGGAFAANHHGHEDRGFSARGPSRLFRAGPRERQLLPGDLR